MTARAEEVTRLLAAAVDGDHMAADALLPILYDELRILAASRLRSEAAPGVTITPTVLVHEAYLRLVGPAQSWNSRGHFFGAASLAMRRLLVERARRKRVPMDRSSAVEAAADAAPTGVEDMLALDDALIRLEQEDEKAYRATMLQYFAGLSREQIAEDLGVSISTVRNKLAAGRTRLQILMGVQKA